MSISRRKVLAAGALTTLVSSPMVSALAQDVDWPKKPIKAVVHASAGGDTDFNARMIAKYFEQITKVPMIVSNTPGGGGTIAMSEVEGAAADGNTLFFTHSGPLIVTEVSGLTDHKFDSKLDISCIPAVDKGSVLISGPANDAKTLKELIEEAKSKPGKIIYGTEFGGLTHMQGLALAKAAGIDLKFVDVGSASDKITALLGKRIDIASIAFGPTKDYVGTGKLTALAQFGDPANPLLPSDVQTFRAQDIDLAMNNPYVIAFPKGTDPAIIQKMSDLVAQITGIQEYADSLAKTYNQPVTFFPTTEAVAQLNQIRDDYMPFADSLRRTE